MKKVIIIGGGISGLTAGIYARKAGFETEIYEKNNIVGGECTGWDRQGFHIDNCIHWLMGTTPNTGLNKIWKETGALSDDVEIIKSDKMYTSELNEEKATLWKDVDRTEKELIELSKEDEEEIKKLMHFVRMSEKIQIPSEKPTEMMSALDSIKMIFAMGAALKIFKEYDGQDTIDLINKFKHPLIRCLISDFCTKESLASSFPMAYGNFASGDGGIPRGGSRKMAIRMQKRFEELGGKVVTNISVEKINVDNGHATGITLKDEKVINGDYIICSCDPDYTFNKLLDKKYMDNVLQEVYKNRKEYPVYGMFQVAYAIDDEKDVLDGDINLDCNDIKDEEWMGERITVKTYSYEPDFSPKGKQILQALLGLSEEAYDYWKKLYENKEEYNKKKNELAEKIMRKIEKRFPDYLDKMSVLDIWTPMTYKRYCNAYKGYNQAFTITKHSMKNPYPSAYIAGLDNVILAGQWLSPPGGLPGAAIQGKYAIQRILRKDKKAAK